MLTADEIAARRDAIASAPDLRALLGTIEARIAPLLRQRPVVPTWKALLSTDGGICPDDAAPLLFDPWSAEAHRCTRCGTMVRGERHDRHWAKHQHLWLAERIADLATVAVLADRDDAGALAADLLRHYGEHYFEYPARDNVLGPARLFFSTYLESIWLTGMLDGAVLLRENGRLDEATSAAVSQLADEAANLIGDFDEGRSNRQTWNDTALMAVAVWFEDEELAQRALAGPSGLAAHLLEGFGKDGLWYEGENYHLFALRGLLLGIDWARAAGVDLIADPMLAERLDAALRAPAITALPNGTFPARKDARFGISLAQPMYLELWELGLGDLREIERPDQELEDWLAALYATPAPEAWPFESYLHEVGIAAAERTHRRRSDLSWWSLLRMQPEEHGNAAGWRPPSMLLESQGLALFRSDGRYASLECGPSGGGHGHPDRLNLTLFSNGVYWLPDFGTGSYVSRDLFWYRSTLAHNAPLLDGRSQQPTDAECQAFDVAGEWGWAQGRFGSLSRTIVAAPGYLLDLLEFTSGEDHVLDLAWHLAGEVTTAPSGNFVAQPPLGEFVSDVERLERSDDAPVTLTDRVDDAELRLRLLFQGELLRAVAPGAPGAVEPATFYLVRATGRHSRIVTIIDTSHTVSDVDASGEEIVVTTAAGSDRHRLTGEGWDIEHGGETIRLRGARTTQPDFEPFVTAIRPLETRGQAPWIAEPPALDGTLDGFNTSSPLLLDHEDQYRRSEEPYSGPEEFSATGWANWHADSLYLAIEVSKPDLVFRAGDAPPLRLDNEPDDIHSDGLQVYVQSADSPAIGYLVVPEEGGGLRVRPASGSYAAANQVSGAWQPTDSGYRVTIALPLEEPPVGHGTHAVGFDLIVNEMLPDRERRAGQLVWSGGGGWVWLRGDRQAPEQFGQLELV